ncbi:MAG: V4R domain-containing protein [Blastocatellia bacterium]
MARVKGGKISSKLTFVKESYGPEMLERVRSSLPLADQSDLKLILDTGWYDFDLYNRVNTAICKVAAEGDQSIYEKMGWHSAEVAFGKTYKVFLAKNVKDLLGKIESMHMLRNEPAEMNVEFIDENSCRVSVTSPKSTVEICKINKGFYERSFQLCGGKNVVCKELQCTGSGADQCVFDITWTSGV